MYSFDFHRCVADFQHSEVCLLFFKVFVSSDFCKIYKSLLHIFDADENMYFSLILCVTIIHAVDLSIKFH